MAGGGRKGGRKGEVTGDKEGGIKRAIKPRSFFPQYDFFFKDPLTKIQDESDQKKGIPTAFFVSTGGPFLQSSAA